MTETQRAKKIIAALADAYPDAACSLGYAEPYQLLISVRLAAQCTDARVNVVTETLFAVYPTLEAFAKADADAVEAIVRPCGLGKTKSRDIVHTCRILLERHGGLVPDNMEALLALPGVGRKSANLILGDVYGQPAVVCDTHCIRITNLMGLSSSKNPTIVEQQLRAILPAADSSDFCHRLVLHGRLVCKARAPQCSICVARRLCAHGKAGATPCIAGKTPQTP